MKTNLYTNFYQDTNAARQQEIVTCLTINLYNPEIDQVFIIVAKHDEGALDNLIEQTKKVVDTNKIRKLVIDGRPIFNDFFNYSTFEPEAMNIIANADIFQDAESLRKLKKWNWGNNCLALSRWDIQDNGLNLQEAVHFDRPDSQDTWITKGGFPSINLANFTMGIAGCDNVVAYLLSQHKNVINPSRTIKTYHYHLVNARNYINPNGQVTERLKPPYKLIEATTLP